MHKSHPLLIQCSGGANLVLHSTSACTWTRETIHNAHVPTGRSTHYHKSRQAQRSTDTGTCMPLRKEYTRTGYRLSSNCYYRYAYPVCNTSTPAPAPAPSDGFRCTGLPGAGARRPVLVAAAAQEQGQVRGYRRKHVIKC